FGFTKANELFVGRLAQLGIAFSLIGEVITGKGALAQLNIETGIPINEIEPLVLFNVLFFFIAALNPGTGKFVTDEEMLNSVTCIHGQAPPPKPKVEDGIFGTSGGIGFTKQNELFVGRVAMLGIAFSLIGEVITGKGALAQLNIETGIPINEIEPLVLFNVLFFFIAALNPGTGKFVTDEGED
ncbi:unnamed protein product, partial [Linum tenue]